jgi:hypothetical protein
MSIKYLRIVAPLLILSQSVAIPQPITTFKIGAESAQEQCPRKCAAAPQRFSSGWPGGTVALFFKKLLLDNAQLMPIYFMLNIKHRDKIGIVSSNDISINFSKIQLGIDLTKDLSYSCNVTSSELNHQNLSVSYSCNPQH